MVGPTSDSVDASVVGAIAVACELPNGELVLDADGAGIFVGGFDRPAELRNEGETVLGLSPRDVLGDNISSIQGGSVAFLKGQFGPNDVIFPEERREGFDVSLSTVIAGDIFGKDTVGFSVDAIAGVRTGDTSGLFVPVVSAMASLGRSIGTGEGNLSCKASGGSPLDSSLGA